MPTESLSGESLYFTDVDGIGSLRPLADFELDGVAIRNRSLDFGLVNEEVFTVFLFYESESFYSVKPLYCTLRHILPSRHSYYFIYTFCGVRERAYLWMLFSSPDDRIRQPTEKANLRSSTTTVVESDLTY